MIKVLIVEDSPVTQELLAYTLSTDPSISITGFANNGEEALQLIEKEQPDVIAMDWQMPKLNGLEATHRIMETRPIPIVIVTGSIALNDTTVTFSLMEAGALAIVKKPHGIHHPDYGRDAKKLIETLKLMSEIKLVRRSNANRINKKNTVVPSVSEHFQSTKHLLNDKKQDIQIVVIGASTGGPLILQKILKGLSKNISVPVLIVQHITKGFINGFSDWLGKTTGFPIHVASEGETLLAGHAYIAPDDYHTGIINGPKIKLSNHSPENGLRPSVSFLFRSTAETYGTDAIGILLSGMGSDGAVELKLMRDAGAITIAQDQESSVVFGMPGEAIKLKAAKYILAPDEMINMLNLLIKKKSG